MSITLYFIFGLVLVYSHTVLGHSCCYCSLPEVFNAVLGGEGAIGVCDVHACASIRVFFCACVVGV